MSDQDLELYRQHRTGQHKYAYFLLAAAASGIALAVRSTTESTLHWSLIPIGLGVISWGLSFFCGCRHLESVQSQTFANAGLLRVQSGGEPSLGGESLEDQRRG
jgi:hypothetical protein